MVHRINQINIDSIEAVLRKELTSSDTLSSQEHLEGKIKTFRDRFFCIQQLANQRAPLRKIANDILVLTNS